MLKTPPPYGGGELRAAALRDYVVGKKDFIVWDLSSEKRNKSTQGKFEIWKIKEFILQWCRFYSPSKIFCRFYP